MCPLRQGTVSLSMSPRQEHPHILSGCCTVSPTRPQTKDTSLRPCWGRGQCPQTKTSLYTASGAQLGLPGAPP